MRLVHNHEVVREALNLILVDPAFRRVDRGDHEVVSSPVLELVHDLEGESELDVHLLLPLRHQGGGRQDQNLPREPTDDELLEDDPRFDGLTKPDLVCEDRPPAHLPEDLEGGIDLIIVAPHAPDQGKAEQLVETGSDAEEECSVMEDPVPRVLDDAVPDLREDLRIVRREPKARDARGRGREEGERFRLERFGGRRGWPREFGGRT